MYHYAYFCCNGIKVKVDKKEAAKYYKMAIDHEIPEQRKEHIFLFHNII